MKKLILILSLTFTVMLSSPSNAEWKKISEPYLYATQYVDFESIRKVDGYVFWWELFDYGVKGIFGDRSVIKYIQGDCKIYRLRTWKRSFHKEPMGRDAGKHSSDENPEWQYPRIGDGSMLDMALKAVCNH